MAKAGALDALTQSGDARVVGVFGGPWDTGRAARDGAVLGFEDVFHAFSTIAKTHAIELVTANIGIFRDYQRIRTFLAACDAVYANCGPWAALLYLVREREQLDVRIIREVRTVGWLGYIWQEEVAGHFARERDQRIFPSRYAQDIWDAATPGASGSRVYYPMIRKTSVRTAVVTGTRGRAGFFSALSRDKGFASLPAVISRMLACGHHIDQLVLAGDQADPALYLTVVNELADIGVEVSYHGGLPNDEVRQLMSGCDCIFFLSVSSIESLGRVMIEASEQGVPVVTADFGAARDLVHASYRIPVRYFTDVSGPCDNAFPLAALDVQRWTPPPGLSSDSCFLETVDEYRVDAQTAAAILGSSPAALPVNNRPVTFSFACHADGLDLAHRLLDETTELWTAPDHELLDLGGALKQYLLGWGYNPQVCFEPVSATQTQMQEICNF